MTIYTFKCFSIAKVHDNYEHLYIYYEAIGIYKAKLTDSK